VAEFCEYMDLGTVTRSMSVLLCLFLGVTWIVSDGFHMNRFL